MKKLIEELLESNRNSPVLTPFAIAFVQLFDENNKILGSGKKNSNKILLSFLTSNLFLVRNPMMSRDNTPRQSGSQGEETMKMRYFNATMKLIKPGTVMNGDSLYEWLTNEQKVAFLETPPKTKN